MKNAAVRHHEAVRLWDLLDILDVSVSYSARRCSIYKAGGLGIHLISFWDWAACIHAIGRERTVVHHRISRIVSDMCFRQHSVTAPPYHRHQYIGHSHSSEAPPYETRGAEQRRSISQDRSEFTAACQSLSDHAGPIPALCSAPYRFKLITAFRNLDPSHRCFMHE